MIKSLDLNGQLHSWVFLGQLFRDGSLDFCQGSKKVLNLKVEQNVLLQEISLLIKYHQTLSIDAYSLTSLQYWGKIHGKVKNYSGNLSQPKLRTFTQQR